MTTVRDYRAELAFVPAEPKVRDYRLALDGTAVPTSPKVRDYRVEISGTAAVLIAPLTGRTVRRAR